MMESDAMNLRLLLTLIAVAAALCAGCTEKPASESPMTDQRKAVVSDDGRAISFPEGSPGLAQIGASPVKKGRATLSVSAPARIVATISASMTEKDRIVLFESADVTSLYSSYRQARSNNERAERNLVRIKDMYDNQAATGRDVNEAENDASTARASMVEMEGRLRALGFNPVELEAVPVNSVWLIVDVPETEMNQVQRGETVAITFNAFPQTVYHGRADALGDIVDPVTRTVKVRVSVQNERARLLPGMFARVTFGQEQESAIILPLSAVVTVEGKDHVFVESGPGQYRRREVVLVNSTGTEVVVLKGLEDSERVVTRGTMLLKGLSFGY